MRRAILVAWWVMVGELRVRMRGGMYGGWWWVS